MKLGNKIRLILIFLFISINLAFAEEKISSTPLINLEKIKPGFEVLEDISEKNLLDQNLKQAERLKPFVGNVISLHKFD